MKSKAALMKAILLIFTLLGPAEAGQLQQADTLTAIPWAYKFAQTPEQVLGFLKANRFIDFRVTATDKSATAFHIFYRPATGAAILEKWDMVKFPSVKDVLAFLNNKVKPPFCAQPRVCASASGGLTVFYVFFKMASQPPPGYWESQELTEPFEVSGKMSMKAGEKEPQKGVDVFWVNGRFYLLYQPTAPAKKWDWSQKLAYDEALKFMNGKAPYNRFISTAAIAAREEAKGVQFFVFHR